MAWGWCGVSEDKEAAIASIALRQVRVSRSASADKKSTNPMNRLVPYLDLFGRLSDEEIARLAAVPTSVATGLRQQVVSVDRALTRFADLIPRLSDSELVRLTGATPKTIRFWRLCQPKWLAERGTAVAERTWSVADAAEKLGRPEVEYADLAEEPPLESGAPLRRHPSGETSVSSMIRPTHDSSELPAVGGPPPSGEDSGIAALRDSQLGLRDSQESQRSSAVAYRMSEEERDGGRGRRSARDSQPGTFAAPPSPRPASRPQPAASAQPVSFSGGPSRGYDNEPETGGDGVFIGLELPDPQSL